MSRVSGLWVIGKSKIIISIEIDTILVHVSRLLTLLNLIRMQVFPYHHEMASLLPFLGYFVEAVSIDNWDKICTMFLEKCLHFRISVILVNKPQHHVANELYRS